MNSRFNSAFINFFQEAAEEKKSIDRNKFINMEMIYQDTEVQ